MIGILKTSKPLEVTDNKKSLTARFAEEPASKSRSRSSSSAGGLKGTNGYVVLMPAVLHVFPGILKSSKPVVEDDFYPVKPSEPGGKSYLSIIEKDLKNSTPNIFVVLLRSLICGAFSASPSRVAYPETPAQAPPPDYGDLYASPLAHSGTQPNYYPRKTVSAPISCESRGRIDIGACRAGLPCASKFLSGNMDRPTTM